MIAGVAKREAAILKSRALKEDEKYRNVIRTKRGGSYGT
jgi:hypothetical protein